MTRTYVRAPMPAACLGCKRPLRRKNDPKKPGTVRFSGRGMCGSCYNAGHAVTPRPAQPAACVRCERPMQPRGQERKSGYALHRVRGLCTGCHSAEVRLEKKLLAYVLGGTK